ncbi:GNAT family N-acetyltransferase [Microbacterium sp. SS28]|uniref:GNAT family N-acetyltransferase n=1 Tax=Microbacterium sp. SS28 TaxID=2919948 RepID=UPI001FA94683|nr:GNAT family N-acetyltransferase [Microbacterium sp. SS28]
MDTSSSLTVRPWRPEDDVSLIEGFVATYNGEPWNDSWTLESATRYLGEFRAAPRSTTLVAVASEGVVGAAYFHARTWQDESEMFIDEFFVFPASQRQGIGRALMAGVRDRATAEGVATLTLITDRDMPAFEFYAGLGFREGSTQVFMIG